MTDTAGAGFRPWQRPTSGGESTTATPDREQPRPTVQEGARQQTIQSVVADVLDRTHRAVNQARETRVTRDGLVRALRTAQQVHLANGELRVGTLTFPVSAEKAAELTLLQPQVEMIRALADVLKSGVPGVVSLPEGVDGGATARWFFEVAGSTYRHHRISRITSLDSLAGALRPDTQGRLRVHHGPLTECIMNGGVFVAECLEQAEKDVLAILSGLAKGVKEFHHPVSGKIVPVHPDFRLVLMTSNRVRCSAELTSACALTEVAAYTRDDHVRLLAQHTGISRALANKLAEKHEAIQQRQTTDQPDQHIDFGRGFPLAYPMLERVAQRLKDLPSPQPQDVANAMWGVYGTRLASDGSKAALRAVITADGTPEPQHLVSQPQGAWTPVGPQAEALAQAEAAHRAGEAIMFTAPGQAGATSLVSELARRFDRELVTVTCHPGVDPQSLIERPVFKKDGSIEFVPGVITDALLNGKILYFDHIDHLSVERQEALLRLVEKTTLTVLEGGRLVSVPVHPESRIYFSSTAGADRTRRTPPARERALLTEIRFDAPTLSDAFTLIPQGTPGHVRELIEKIATEIHAEAPQIGLLKLQRFRDFAGAAALLAAYVPAEQAVAHAARLLFDEAKSPTLAKLPQLEDRTPPVWMSIMNLSPEEVRERVASTGYDLTPSMADTLLPLAIAYKLERPVLTVGKAAAGKTVLGILWAAIADKTPERYNFSAATEASDLYGGLSPVKTETGVQFQMVSGPLIKATLETQGAWIGDERNLSTEAMMSMKSLLDHRRAVIDPESGLPRSIGGSILYFAENPLGTRGRKEQPPVIDDCMFRVVVREKPVAERANIVASQCGLPRQWRTSIGGMFADKSFDPVLTIAKFFVDLEAVWTERPAELGKTFGPLTCTERDMLKAARRAEHLIKRDGITDPNEQRRILGRETMRLVRGLLQTPDASQRVFDTLIKRHFGSDVHELNRPKGVERVTIDGVDYLKIGVARYPVRKLDKPELQAMVPGKDRIGEPVGAQLEFLEDALLALELDQPLAIVGITGSGKTMLVRYLAHHLNQPLLEQAYHADMSEENIFGTTVLTPDGAVRFQESPLDIAAQIGAWYCGDELLTLPNQTRESLNPVTEGSQIKIPSRPARTLRRRGGPPEDRWHSEFRQIFTTNGDDIRADGFSDPEASRLVIVGIREPRGFDELNEIAQRDYCAGKPRPLLRSPRSFDESDRNSARDGLLEICRPGNAFGDALKLACIDPEPLPSIKGFFKKLVGMGKRDEAVFKKTLGLALATTPIIDLTPEQERAIAVALWQFKGDKFLPLRELLSALLVKAKDPQSAARVAGMVPAGSLSVEATKLADANVVVGDRLASAEEVARLVAFFDELRTLQGGAGASPLTPRLLSSFLELYIEKRRTSSVAAAAMRAAELNILDNMPPELQSEALARITRTFGHAASEAVDLLVPRQEGDSVYFGNTRVPLGPETPWRPSNERFPLTPARVQNLACIADADVMGRGRPMSITDDPNGESMETLREYARLLGKRLVVVTLTPNTDIEQLIEKLVLTDDPTVKGGFAPELQEIAQAVKEGHLLVLRGCGSIPSSKLERLNSLGDGRQSVDLPRSARTIKANPSFRMIMLRKPGSPHEFSPALQNRLLTPLLSTREQAPTQEVLSRAASELLENIHHRTQISVDSARLLARFHVCMNELLRKGEFASALAIGSFLNRDAEAVARRLKHLTAQGAVTDEVETLHRLITDVYGERFDNESDRALFAHLTKRFICEGIAPPSGTDVSATQHFVRFGEWSVPRDSRGIRNGVPGHEAILPRVEGLDEIQSKEFAAAQFAESLHVHGDPFVSRAAIQSMARLSASEVIEIEGNEELSESSLFGGLVQNDDGRFERYEGLVWRAQREASILLIRNAARLPRDLLVRLSEIAATDNVERVRDGKLEIQQKRLRLVLQTSIGDPPLPQELAAACTRVRAEPVAQRQDLIALTSHVLAGVPGGTAMASAFVDLIAAADASLAGVSLQDRQLIRYDGQRLLFMASDVARAASDPDADLQEIVASAITRHVLAPVDRLPARDAVVAAVDNCLAQLYGSSGILTAQSSNAVDIVANPHLATLKKDYDQVAATLTGALLKSTKEAVLQLLAADDDADLRMLVGRLPTGGLLPADIERACARLQSTPPGTTTITAPTREAAKSLIQAIDDAALPTKVIEGDVLEFMRGARLWDLEHRCEIVSRYSDAFALCAGFGSEAATASRRELASVTERFEASAAEGTIRQVRESVEEALEIYRKHGGGTDNVLQERYEKVIERWDWVTGTPLFKNHHQLRGHLAELHSALDALREAHDDRGATRDEVSGLLTALRNAGSALEGIRIAEQSADLRRAVADAQRGTREVVAELLGHLAQVKMLRAAKDMLATLGRVKKTAGDLGRAEFMQLPSGPIKVEAPPRPSKSELEAEATHQAEREERDKLEAARADVFAELAAATLDSKAPPVDKFFADYDIAIADTGIAQPTAPLGPSAAQAVYEDALARLKQESGARIADTKRKVLADLEKKKAEEYETTYKQRVESAVERTASRNAMAAIALAKDLQLLATQLGDAADVTTTRAIEDARAALRTSESEARAWGDGLRRRFGFGRIIDDGGGPLYLRQHEPPSRDHAIKLVEEALAKIEERVNHSMAGLPDISPLEGHIASCGAIEDVLASSDTLGLASSRFAALHQAARENVEVSGALQASIARLGPDATSRNLLMRVAAFSEVADNLSSRFAAKSGVAFGFANVIEATMRAAQVIRQQSLRDKSSRSCIAALDNALQRYQEAAKSAQPDAQLKQLEQEMIELKRAFLGAQTTAKSVTLQDAGVDAIFEMLSSGSGRGGSHGERIRNALDGEAFANDRNVGATNVLSRIVAPTPTQTMTVRDTELRLIDLSTVGLRQPQQATVRDRDSSRGKVHAVMDDMLQRTVAAGDRLTQAHGEARTILGALEKASQGNTWQRASATFNAAKDALDALARGSDADIPALHTSLDATLDALAKVLAVIEPSDLFPTAATAKLGTIVEAGRELKLVFDQNVLAREVMRFAMSARSQLDEVQELAPKSGDAGGGGQDAMALARLAEIIDTLGTDTAALTAYSRRALFHSMAARLAQIGESLAGDEARGAKELSARAARFRDELAQYVPTATAERCLAEIAAAFTELGGRLDNIARLSERQVADYQKLAEAVDEVCLSSLERHKLVPAIDVAIDCVAPFITDQMGPLAGAGRDIESHLKALAGELFNDDAGRVADHFTTGVAPYLKEREAVIARLGAAQRALATFDSTSGMPAVLVQEILESARTANALTKGPYSGRIAAALVSLTDAVLKAQSMPHIGSELEKVADTVRELRAEAERFAGDAASSNHFEGMALKLREYLGKLGKNKPSVATLQQAQAVVDAMLGLLAVEARSVPKQVASVASKYFGGSIRGLEVASPRAQVSQGTASNMGRVHDVSSSIRQDDSGKSSNRTNAPSPFTNANAEAAHGQGLFGVGSGGGGGAIDGDVPVQPVGAPPADEPEGNAPLAEPASPTNEVTPRQNTVGNGAASSRGTIEVIELSEVAVQNTVDEMQAALAAQRLVGAQPGETRSKNAFERFCAENQALVDNLRAVLRQYPCEVVVVVDQSGSTQGQVIQHEQAVVAMVMGALLGSEGSCSVLGLGDNIGIGSYVPGTNMEGAQVWVHKPMSQPLTADSADATYRVCGNANGGTIIIPALNTALGQFTSKSNDKLILIMTDAQVNNAGEIRNLIDQARANGVGVAMLGFSEARNVQSVAGEFGMHVTSFRGAVDGAASLLAKCLVSNQGRFRGRVEAKGAGIGTAILDLPLSAAGSPGPMAASLRLAQPFPTINEPSEVLGSTGDAREVDQLATRAIYDAACKQLELAQRKATATASYRACRAKVAELWAEQQRDGTAARLRDAVSMSLPRAGGVQLLRKQPSGPLIDEQQIPFIVAGLAQGVPPTRIFKRRKGSDEIKAQVVLAIDESSSMGDSEKARANIEALIAYGDALKAVDKDIKIAVIGYSDRVRLHAGFEQDWNDELKAHLLHQIRCEGDATDDERGIAEGAALLDMLEADIGQIVSFGDGQGLPGTHSALKTAVAKGYSVIAAGIGAECKGVLQFGDHALYARNLSQFVHQFANVALRCWERASLTAGK